MFVPPSFTIIGAPCPAEYRTNSAEVLASMPLILLYSDVTDTADHLTYDVKDRRKKLFFCILLRCSCIKPLVKIQHPFHHATGHYCYRAFLSNLSKILVHESGIDSLDICVYPNGYRILSNIPRLPYNILENLIEKFGSFQEILKASTKELDEVEGIGEIRARIIKEDACIFKSSY